MMTAQEVSELRPGDYVEWNGIPGGRGWVLQVTPRGMYIGWSNGELTHWPSDDTALQVRLGSHLTLIKREELE